MKSKVEILSDIIKDRFDVDLDFTTFKRSRAGYIQRMHGAWSWYMIENKTGMFYGSPDSVTELLRNKENIEIISDEIFIK